MMGINNAGNALKVILGNSCKGTDSSGSYPLLIAIKLFIAIRTVPINIPGIIPPRKR